MNKDSPIQQIEVSPIKSNSPDPLASSSIVSNSPDPPIGIKKLTKNISPISTIRRDNGGFVYRRDLNKNRNDHIKNENILVREHMGKYFQKTSNRGLNVI